MNQKIRVAVMLLFSLMLISTLHSNPIQAAEKKGKDRLAVIDLNAKYGVDKALAEALSVIIRDKLHSFGEYQVMSAEDIQQVASREQLMQAIGSDDAAGQFLVDFGRKIDSRFMVAGDVSKIGATYTVSLRMLDTKGEGAGVIKRVSESCKCEEDALIVTAQDVAAKLVGKPTVSAKKAEEEKKLVDLKKTEDAESKRLAEEKKKLDELEKRREAGLAEERRLAEEQKQKLAAEIEKLKAEKGAAMAATPRLAATGTSSPSKTYTDPTIGTEFVYIPSGCFQMGQTEAEKDQILKEDGKEKYEKRSSDEGPQHEICVDGFSMAKYEVTVSEWRKFAKVTNYLTDAEKNVNENGCFTLIDKKWAYQGGLSWNDVGFPQTERYPVACVSHNDVVEFISWLNRESNRKYRLPTEAEREYAVRAGTSTTRFWGNGDGDACRYANVADKSSASTNVFPCDDGYKWSSPVGTFQPNDFGLYDMLGNVWEWTGDWYDKDYYAKSPKKNPQGPSSGSNRVTRGGGWGSGPIFVRSADRSSSQAWRRSSDIGFRLVIASKEKQ